MFEIDMKPTVSYNKITGEVMGYSPRHTVSEVKIAIEKARIARKTWAEYPVSLRVQKLVAVKDHLCRNMDEIVETISRETGKTRIDALSAEVFSSVLAISYYCKKAKSFLKDKTLRNSSIVFSNKKSVLKREPYGVVGIISPWNYPFSIPFSEAIMALLAGNAVVLKTATETQQTGLALKSAIEAAGLLPSLFTFINMPGSEAGNAFLENGIDKMFFTGSVSTGKKLMSKASETLTPLVLELGGNDAMLVCEDADLWRATGGAVWAGFHNAGQSCAGVERIYVHESVYEPFLRILKEKVEALRVGFDENFNVDVGAMTKTSQIETVTRHIDDAVSRGATIFAQSRWPEKAKENNFFPPTVLTDVNHDMAVMREETFGPLVGIMKVKNMEEGIRLANDSQLGLTGSVWSKNRKKASKLASKIEAGVVTINDHLMSHGMPETPWGGFKQSGIGHTHGKVGFNEMTRPRVVIDDLFFFAGKNLWWPPYDKTVYDGLKAALDLIYSPSATKRFRSVKKLIQFFPRMFHKG